jgi:hypothetical protein
MLKRMNKKLREQRKMERRKALGAGLLAPAEKGIEPDPITNTCKPGGARVCSCSGTGNYFCSGEVLLEALPACCVCSDGIEREANASCWQAGVAQPGHRNEKHRRRPEQERTMAWDRDCTDPRSRTSMVPNLYATSQTEDEQTNRDTTNTEKGGH